MAERPILFNGEIVRAILAGQKTQTRRPVKPQRNQKWWLDSYDIFPRAEMERDADGRLYAAFEHPLGGPGTSICCPLGQPGDRLWVRETWGLHAHFDYTDWNRDSIAGVSEDNVRGSWVVAYQADAESPYDHWRPSIHMPRWASRITLEITDVRVQRVQEISEEDARSEGLDSVPEQWRGGFAESYREQFGRLWSRIYGAESWTSNAWVWAVTFRRVDADGRAP